MRSKERIAIDTLEFFKLHLIINSYRDFSGNFDIAIEAMNKLIAKDPVIITEDVEIPKTHNLGKLLQYRCPSCNKLLFSRYETDTVENGFSLNKDFNYCSKCGQKIDLDEFKFLSYNDELELE